ncbi:MAG: hypothetical protein COB36_07610 [Alphaproteobacteria bacterium]|nr:MAG: hypothetical protein COB36_07610 [Alphaproteobacteria bacterium]
MMFYKKISKYCLTLSLLCFGVSGFSSSVSSATVIEFFGSNSCSSDVDVQDALKNILQNEKNIIVINCRTWSIDKAMAKTFAHQFCNDRLKSYTKKFKVTNMFYAAPLVVNGRWDALYKNIMPAVKMGKFDKIEEITMNLHDNMLDISIPSVESAVGSGDIMLYAYTPSQGGELSLYVDADVVLTDDMRERLRKNQSVPFVTKESADPLYIRPVLSMAKIGHWNGTQISMTVPLGDMVSMAASKAPDLSYVVVLYEGGEVGPVLAVGEVVSLVEFNSTLPQSRPQDIKYISPSKL